MKLLVIGSGMMGSAAAFDMARQDDVTQVTLADADLALAKAAVKRLGKSLAAIGRKADAKKLKPVKLDASNYKAAGKLMRLAPGGGKEGHAACLSAVPYFYNVGLAKAAIEAKCHFADLGGNNVVVRKTYALSAQAAKRRVCLAPDCGVSPGMASVLAGELFRRVTIDAGNAGTSAAKADESSAGSNVRSEDLHPPRGAESSEGVRPVDGGTRQLGSVAAGRPPAFQPSGAVKSDGQWVDALKIYVGGLPEDAQPPFHYQLVFSVNGLINEYVEPARVLRGGKVQDIEPLTEPEPFGLDAKVYGKGFEELVAFHTSGGTSTLPETFKGRVGECFEKTLRYPLHYVMVRNLYDLGYFSSEPIAVADKKGKKVEVTPRAVTSQIFLNAFTGSKPDVTIMRVEAHKAGRVASFTIVDHYDRATRMTSMMKTTAWSASIVVLMMARGMIMKYGGVYQETDVPAEEFLRECSLRGIGIKYSMT